MSKITKEWLGVVAFGIFAGAFIAIAVWSASPDDCKPRDGSDGARRVFNLVIGGSMLMAGCAESRPLRSRGAVRWTSSGWMMIPDPDPTHPIQPNECRASADGGYCGIMVPTEQELGMIYRNDGSVTPP